MALTNTDPFFTPYIRQDGTESKSKMFLTKTQAQILEAAAAKYGLTGELKKSFFVTPFAESGASVPVEINGVKHTIFTPQNYAASAYADGPFQFTPGTAASMGLENPNDFEESAYASAKYIKKLYDMAVKRGEKDPVAAATVYYNRGPKHTYNTGKETDTPLPNETKEYLKRKNNNKDNVYELVSKAMTEGIDEIRFLEPEVKKKSKARIAYEKKHGIATKTDEVAEIDKKAQREHDKELEAQRQKYFFDEQLKLQEKEERKKMLTETPLFKDIDLDVEAEKLGMYKKGGNVNLSAQEQTAKENEGFDLINNIPVIGNSIITSVNSVNALRDNKKENNAQAVGSLIGNVADMTALAFGIPTAGLGEKLGSAIGSNLSKKDSSQLVSSFYKPQFQKGGCTSCKLRKYSFQDGGYANGNYLNYRDNSGISEDYKRRTIERNKLLQDVIKEANRRIAENDYFHLPKHIANTEEMRGKNPNNYTCIGGVCDIFQTLGLIPKDSNVYNNSDFQQRAYSLNFVNDGNDISKLRPGSIIQYKHATNADGTNIPNHAQLFLGMTPDGRYRFFDNYYATSGHGSGERFYTEDELKYHLTEVFGKGDKPNDNYAQIWNYGHDVSDESMFKERRLPGESKLDRQYDNDDYKMHVKYQPGDNTYNYEVKEELPSDKLRFNASRKQEQEIIDVFNDPEFDQKLKDTFLITQNTLDELKPVIYGIMSQESSFGAPINPVNNIKYKLEKLLPKNKVSKGLGAVNYSYMRDPAKKLMESEVKSVGKGNALYKPKGGIIGTLDLLLQSGAAADNYMPENPELMDDHPWAPALYFYNGQGRNLKRGYASDGSTLNVEEGSYPHKVFTEAERLKRKKLQNGGYVYSIEGYKEDSPDRFNDYNLINSGNITMKGVNQPILGVDNLGNSKIMLPGKDYKFPGTKVLERPLRKLNKYQDGGDTDEFNRLVKKYKKHGWESLTKEEQKTYRVLYDQRANLGYGKVEQPVNITQGKNNIYYSSPVAEVTASPIRKVIKAADPNARIIKDAPTEQAESTRTPSLGPSLIKHPSEAKGYALQVIQYPVGYKGMAPGHIEARLIFPDKLPDKYKKSKTYVNRWVNNGNRPVTYTDVDYTDDYSFYDRKVEDGVRIAYLDLSEADLDRFIKEAEGFTPGETTLGIPTARGGEDTDYDFVNSNCANGVCRALGYDEDNPKLKTMGMVTPQQVMDKVLEDNRLYTQQSTKSTSDRVAQSVLNPIDSGRKAIKKTFRPSEKFYQKGGDTAPSYEEYVATKKWWDGLSDAQKEHIHMRMLYPEHMKILEIGGKYYNSENALPTVSVTAKRLFKHEDKPISKQTPQREGDSFIENTIELFDPTGVSSWDDVGRAWGDGKFNYEDIIEPLGAIPAIGKPLSWGAKGVKTGMKAARAVNKSGSLKRVYDLLNYGRDVYGDNINPNLKLGGSTDSNVITKFQLGGSTAGGTIPASEMKGTSTSSPIPLKNAVINTSTNPDNSNFSQFRNIPFNSPIQPGDVYNRGQSLAASELSLINSDEGRRRLDYMNRVGKDDPTIADPNRTSGQVLNRLGNSLLTTADPRNRSSSFGYNSNNNSITLNSKEPINGTLAFDINRAINDNKASWMDKYLIDNVKFTDDYLKKFDINSGKTPTSYLREARQEMVDAGIINSLYDEITSDHIIKAFNYFNNNENASNTEYDYTIENDPNIFRTINPDLRDGQENYLFNELSKLDNEKTTIKDEIRKLEKIISTPTAHTNTYLGTSSDINDEITKARNKIIQYEIRLGEIERDKQNINNTLENRSNINVVHGNKQKGLFFKNLRPSGKKGMDAILHIMNNLASNDKAQSPTTRMAKYGGEVDGRAQIEIEGDEYVFNADGLGREDFKMLNNEGITNSSDVGFLAKGDSHAKGGIGVITGKAYIGSKYLGLDGKKSSKTNPSVATEMLKQGGYALSNADSNDKFGLSKKYTPNAYKHTVNSMQKVADKAEYNKKIEESIKTIDESIKSIKSMNNRYYKSGGYMGKVYDPTRPSAYNSFKRGGMMESPLNLTYDQDLLQYQMGGEMPPEMASQEQAMMEQAMMEQAGGAPQGPEQGGGSPLDSIPPEQKEQVMMLVEAAIQGDQEAMKQLVDIFGEDGVQMIMQEVGQGVQQQAPNPSNDAAMAAMQAAPGEGMQGAMPPTAPPPMMRGGYMMGRGGYMKTPSQYLRSYMGGY